MAALSAAAGAGPRPAWAAWPEKPVRLLVPTGPGSVPDVRARWLAERLAPRLGQPVVVEHRPGAGGLIAMEAAARSLPDGHTLVVTHPGLTSIAPLLLERPGFDWERDFAPITRVGVGPLLLLVAAGSPYRRLADLVQAMRQRTDATNFASPGIGTPPHLAGERLLQLVGARAVHVPYPNPGQPIADLIGGRVQWLLEGTPVALPLVQSGQLRALAVTAPARLEALPEVPAAAEAGVPGLLVEGWNALAAPAATPKEVVEQLYRQVKAVLDDDEARRWFGAVGNRPGGEEPAALAQTVRAERALWAEVIRRAGLAPAR